MSSLAWPLQVRGTTATEQRESDDSAIIWTGPKAKETDCRHFSWSRAFAIYGAALCATTREELRVFGLTCTSSPSFLGTLVIHQWLVHDTEFREWVVAKGVRKWGSIVRPDCLQPIDEQPTAPAEHQGSRLQEEQFKRQSLFGGTLVSPVRKVRHVKLPMHATTVTPCIWWMLQRGWEVKKGKFWGQHGRAWAIKNFVNEFCFVTF